MYIMRHFDCFYTFKENGTWLVFLYFNDEREMVYTQCVRLENEKGEPVTTGSPLNTES